MHLSIDELKERYFDLITTIVPGPASWSYFVPLLLLPAGLLVPPSTLSHARLCAIVVPISLAATIHACLALGGNDVILTDSLYLTLFLYLFKDPRRRFRHVVRSEVSDNTGQSKRRRGHDNNKNEAVKYPRPFILEAYPESFTGRLAWAILLPQSRPLHDWIIGNPSHDRRVLQPFYSPSRSAFTKDILSRLLPVLFVFLPVSTQMARNDPYFSDPTWSIFGPIGSDRGGEGETARFLRASLPLFMIRPLVMALYAYSLLIVLFMPAMLMPVFFNAVCLIPDHWSPHTWPPHFGPISAIRHYGIRGFWGRWWHQQMRHIVSEPGRWCSKKLGLADHGWERVFKYMLICGSAFFLSGVTHSGLVPPKPRFATENPTRLRLSLASFFWIQPVGYAVELFFLEPLVRSLPPSTRGAHGLLRFAWTVVFMCFSCTFLVLPFGQLGYWNIFNLTSSCTYSVEGIM